MKRLIRQHRTKLIVLLAVLVLLPLAALVGADRVCRSASAGRIFQNIEDVPKNDVALVLGTGKLTPAGRPNLHFTQRIEAAAKLYHSGKVTHLLVSGDNHVKSYDEPSDMRDALVSAGVPTNAITRDYAGFRTLDSVLRAEKVFGLKNFTIVTEEFHCPRSLWIARQHGLNAVAFAAPDLQSKRWALRVKVREAFARVLCGADLYLLRTQPKFSGPPEPITLAVNGH
jgi:SanA protein